LEKQFRKKQKKIKEKLAKKEEKHGGLLL